MKTCTKCLAVKPYTAFRKDRRKKSGLQSQCMACQSAYQAKYRITHSEEQKSYLATWRAANPKHKSAWRAANRERCCIHEQNRLASMRKSGGKLSVGLAERLFTLQRGKCACGCKQPLGADYHLDHRMPLALGGTNTDDNMQLLRKTCNLQKYAKHPIDFMQQRGFLL